MSERNPHRWTRFVGSLVTLLLLAVAAPVALIAASRSRFGSANPLAGADPPSGGANTATAFASIDPLRGTEQAP